mmetsp:Transcript_74552/g.189155  ORF Transcript_74552/g.189155 Transcript_74552/m.189155 type:complete len:215 (+) Transcript_74552:764-1408(+)
MGLLEDVFVLLAEGHQGGHVHLVERRESGLRLLRTLEVLGDGQPHAGHLDSVLGPTSRWGGCNCCSSRSGNCKLRGLSCWRWRRRRRRRSSRRCSRWCRRTARGLRCSDVDGAKGHTDLSGLVRMQEDRGQDAGLRGVHLDRYLVGLDCRYQLALLHVVAHFELPLLNGALCDALRTERRCLHLEVLHLTTGGCGRLRRLGSWRCCLDSWRCGC